MKNFVFLLLASLSLQAVAGPCALDALDAELKKTWPNNRTINVIFHGHSVPAGYHASPQVKPFESYPHLFNVWLKQRYPSAVVNVIITAIGGEHSVSGAARFNADVLTRKPDLIFIDYAINDRNKTLAEVETAWRSMVTSAKTAGVPVVLVTPTGVLGENLADPAGALRQRADLIRTIAITEDVLLADVSAAWVAALNGGTPEVQLLSQGNHPNLQGHQLAAGVLSATFTSALCAPTAVLATSFPRNSSTNRFATPDGRLTFTTANTFSGQGDFLGDSGGSGNKTNAWDGAETLTIAQGNGVYLTGFNLRWTVSDIVISGFAANPLATIATVGGSTGSATWNSSTKILTLDVPWNNGTARAVTFNNAAASAGRTLNFSFTDSTPGWQATFTSFQYKTNAP